MQCPLLHCLFVVFLRSNALYTNYTEKPLILNLISLLSVQIKPLFLGYCEFKGSVGIPLAC